MMTFIRLMLIISMMGIIAFMAASLTGCATKLPDIPICIEMSMSRGECVKVVSGEKITVDDTHKMNDKTWWESRPTNMIMPLESWMDLKKFIIEICHQNENMCDEKVGSWERSIDSIDEAQKAKATF